MTWMLPKFGPGFCQTCGKCLECEEREGRGHSHGGTPTYFGRYTEGDDIARFAELEAAGVFDQPPPAPPEARPVPPVRPMPSRGGR